MKTILITYCASWSVVALFYILEGLLSHPEAITRALRGGYWNSPDRDRTYSLVLWGYYGLTAAALATFTLAVLS